MTSILPPNSTTVERAFEAALQAVCDLPVIVSDLWSPSHCPVPFLPWLAWALSVDDWNSEWPEERQRAVIGASVEVHRHKGTVASVKRVLAAAGFGDARLIERWGGRVYDGTAPRNGTVSRAQISHWAKYRLDLSGPITLAQADMVRRLLSSVAPVRCHLDQINYTEAAHLYDATLPRNGAYSRGVA